MKTECTSAPQSGMKQDDTTGDAPELLKPVNKIISYGAFDLFKSYLSMINIP